MNMFAHKPASAAIEPLPLRLARHRLAKIDAKLAEIPDPSATDLTYQAQEIRGLKRDLRDMRRATEAEINAGHGVIVTDPDLAARNDRLLDALEKERDGNKERFISKLYAERDYRQWAIHTLDFVNIRTSIAREYRMQE